jgi:hypothetical protein
VLEVDCKGEKLFADPRRIVSELKKHYGHAGRKFIEYLMQDGIIQDVIKAYNDEFAALQSADIDDKQSLIGAIIIIADRLATELFFRDGMALSRDDIRPLLTTKAQSDSNQRAYEWVLDFVASNPSRFAPDDLGRYQGECWGKVEMDAIYFNKTIFDSKMSDAGFNSTSFLSWAKRNGKIICDAQGKTSKTTRIKGIPGTPRCVCIKTVSETEEDDGEQDELPY